MSRACTARASRPRPRALAAQALWLALAIGCGLAAACAALAVPLMTLLGGSGHVADLAARYLRLSALGLPFALIALSGQGWLRGMSRLREPLVILVAANVVNVVLEVLLVYGLDAGLDGSALGTVIAQLGMGVAFAALLLGAGGSTSPGVVRDAVAGVDRRADLRPHGRAARVSSWSRAPSAPGSDRLRWALTRSPSSCSSSSRSSSMRSRSPAR